VSTFRRLLGFLKPYRAGAVWSLVLEDALPRETGTKPLEAYVPWNLEFLLYRVNCYENTGDPRVGRASRDLEEYLANEKARR